MPALRAITSLGVRELVIGNLLIVAGVIFEQVIFGVGRITGNFVYWAQITGLVAISKLLYVFGFCTLVYAFWTIAPVRPNKFAPFLMAFSSWFVITVILVLVSGGSGS